MQGKTILITGAGSGIGKASAFALARRGHDVIATTHREEDVAAVLKEAEAEGLRMRACKLDITSEADRALVESYDLDVLINNAGIGQTGPLAEVPMDRVRATFETNVFGTLALTQLALKNMLAAQRGTVLFVSSLAGRAPMAFLNPYSMTKYALSGGAAAMRDELHRVAPRVHVSLIEPGAYATGFNEKMMATKYAWLDERSAFFPLIGALKKDDARFVRFQARHLGSIVAQIVKAAEADTPKLRYVAPWIQGFGIRLLRIIGR